MILSLEDMQNDPTAEFLEHPEKYLLYRGEQAKSESGLHFSTDAQWVKNFGPIIRSGTLPMGSRVKLLTEADEKEAFENGIYSELRLWESFFEKGYDAILGHDALNSKALDIIVHPKHAERFKPMPGRREP